MPLFSGIVLWLLNGLVIGVLVGLFIGVLISKFRTVRAVQKFYAPKAERRSADDILCRNRSSPHYPEQPRSGVQTSHLPGESKIDETSLSSVSEPRKTVEEIIESIDSEDVREIVWEHESEIVHRLEDWASEVVDTQ